MARQALENLAMNFHWIPNTSLDENALKRIAENISKPDNVLSVDGRVYESFKSVPRNEISEDEVDKFLRYTTSQIKIYGESPDKSRYIAWFHYLLPTLILKRENRAFFENTISLFLNAHPQSIPELYLGFRNDLFYTLGNCVMNPKCWHNGDLSRVHWWFNHDEVNNLEEQTLNAAIFFCLKYLEEQEIEEWVDSLANIQGKHWRAKFGKWLQRFGKLRRYIENPSLYPPSVKPNPSIGTQIYLNRLGWANTEYVLFNDDYISGENLDNFWQAIRKYPSLESMLEA